MSVASTVRDAIVAYELIHASVYMHAVSKVGDVNNDKL
jgi:hypothetical protein